MTGKLSVATELLATILFPGLRVEIVGVEFVDEFGGTSVRLHLAGEDVPLAIDAAGRLIATIHTRQIEGDPHEWRRVELERAP